MENKAAKELSARDIVRIVRKEIIANRNETTALRAEIAVMRTELSGIHKVMEENKLFIQSMALSLKAVREVVVGAGEGLDSFFVDMTEAAKELIPAMAEIVHSERQSPVATENIDAEFGDEETIDDEPRHVGDIDENEWVDEETPIEEQPDRCSHINIDEKDSSKTQRCCLTEGHGGDHLYRCASVNCPGYPWVASKSSPHPANTCGQIIDGLRKAKVDDLQGNR